jgi:hypothetical protein
VYMQIIYVCVCVYKYSNTHIIYIHTHINCNTHACSDIYDLTIHAFIHTLTPVQTSTDRNKNIETSTRHPTHFLAHSRLTRMPARKHRRKKSASKTTRDGGENVGRALPRAPMTVTDSRMSPARPTGQIGILKPEGRHPGCICFGS